MILMEFYPRWTVRCSTKILKTDSMEVEMTSTPRVPLPEVPQQHKMSADAILLASA